MSEWKLSKFGELADFYDHRRIPLSAKERSKRQGIYPYYGAQDIVDYIDDYIFDGEYVLIAEDGANLTTRNKPIATLASGKFWVNNHAHIIKNKQTTDLHFLLYLLNAHDIKGYITGSAQPKLSQDRLASIPFLIPQNKDYQSRIAHILQSLDDKINLNRQLNDNLEAMAQALYDYWFVQFDFPDENGKPYKSSGGKMVWNEKLKREIPEGWTTEAVGEITLCHDSRRIPLSGKERETMQGDIPYYGATGIFGYVDRHIFDGDFVLLAEDGSVMNEKGRPIIQRVSGKVWINNHTHVLQPSKEHGCKLLMMILSEIPVEKIKTGSIQAKINQANLNAYSLVKIPRTLISQMNKILDEIDSRLLALAREINTLTKQRDFLLPLLMSGQVQVKLQGELNYHLTAD